MGIFDQILKSPTPAVTGGYLYLGLFLHQYLGGLEAGYPYVLHVRRSDCTSHCLSQRVPDHFSCQSARSENLGS
jgi:hypothetical protein